MITSIDSTVALSSATAPQKGENQKVNTSSTDESNKKIKTTPKSNLVETITTDSGKIKLSQEQTEHVEGDVYEKQNTFLKYIYIKCEHKRNSAYKTEIKV